MRAVILAAGRGTRLHPYSESIPKSLVKVLGKPLIENTIRVLKRAGIKDIIIVIGYLGDQIKRYLGDGRSLGVRITYCYNQNYTLENAVSLKEAEGELRSERRFLLLMGDHYFEDGIIESILKEGGDRIFLCIDRSPRHPPQIKDATKVLVDWDNRIIDIGKDIHVWNAVDAGLFMLDNSIFGAIHTLEVEKPSVSITDCIKYLTRRVKPVYGFDISGHLWFDIDTPQDIEFINTFLGRMDAERVGRDSLTIY
ncbi:MAG: sugar phosphate nucleotidyltransferase [Candidatus Bathyarchaeia archaeon]